VLKNHRVELYIFLGALAFSVNGVVSTVVLDELSAFRLAQIRAIAAVILLLIFTLIFKRDLLRLSRKDIPLAIAYGVVGFALVNVGYFIGIERGLPLGLVLVIEFTAPIWVVLWIKYVRGVQVASDMWVAIGLSLAGLVLLTKIWDGFKFDLLGLAAALGSAFALAGYFIMGDKFGRNRHPMGSTVIGLGVASVFWILVLPVWNFPTEIFTKQLDLQGYLAGNQYPGWLLLLWVIVMGTIIPYLFVISGLRLLSASKSSVLGMIEPVMAGAFAWIWLSQRWDFIQLIGAVVVLVGIYIADRSKSATT